jgi:alpha-1,2-mannosyltransferase
VCLLLARSWWRADARAGAIGLVGLGTVLASPVSWTHHWVLAAPLIVGLLGMAPHPYRTAIRAATLGCAAVLASRILWNLPLAPSDAGYGVVSNAYIWVALVLMACAFIGRPRAAQAAPPA